MRKCRVCHCQEDRACNPPCAWEPGEDDLCTHCANAINWLANWMRSAYRPYAQNLVKEAKLEAFGK